jgi:xanthine dehydrogenase accessory factor
MARLGELLSDIRRWLGEGEGVALATVVDVRGSSPRPAGARLAISSSGRMSGAVSAGCVESDVLRRALDVLDSGVAEIARFAAADAPELDVGLSCGGRIEVLIEPVSRDTPVWRDLETALAGDEPVVLAEVIEPAAHRGAKALIGHAFLARRTGAEGSEDDPVDPEFPREILDAVRLHAESLLGRSETATIEVPLAGKTATVFLDSFAAAPHLYVVGATEIGAALCKLTSQLGMRTTVIDPRSKLAQAERFVAAAELVCAWPDEVLDRCGLDLDSAVVTLTHDAKIDELALACALRTKAGYLGALGSHRTHERRLAALRARGFDANDLARIRGPVGLDIGGRSAEEIALSIVAEIIAARNGRDARAPKFVSGIVLAAGASTRMGRPKQLLDLGGRPLLQHVIDAACASSLDEVVIVLGARAATIRRALTVPSGARVRWVVNDDFARGMSESVRAGLAAVSPRATTVAILLGDQPHVSAATIDQTLAQHVAAGKDATRPIGFGADEKRVPGHPVVIERTLWPALCELRGDDGARRVLEACPEKVHEVQTISPAPADIDTWEDYERAAAAQTR